MKNKTLSFLIFMSIILTINAQDNRQFYMLTMYHFENKDQEILIDKYLEMSYLPALHREDIQNIGVFRTIPEKNSEKNLIMVLVPFQSMKQFTNLDKKLMNDKAYKTSAEFFLSAQYQTPPFNRVENILMNPFSSAPKLIPPKMSGSRNKRIYELRSYESATQYLHKQKVKMFDTGEAELFVKLGFQPVFFASVISGSNMPNLMYMICHENESAQKNNWDKFRESAEWGIMKSMEEYKNTVSHIDKWLLYPKEYSDY